MIFVLAQLIVDRDLSTQTSFWAWDSEIGRESEQASERASERASIGYLRFVLVNFSVAQQLMKRRGGGGEVWEGNILTRWSVSLFLCYNFSTYTPFLTYLFPFPLGAFFFFCEMDANSMYGLHMSYIKLTFMTFSIQSIPLCEFQYR